MQGICSCGVTLPLMDKVKGRITDMIKLPDGTAISGDYMTTIFDDVPDAVRQFQVYQKADYSIEILVVPNPSFTGLGKVMEQVKIHMKKAVNDAVPVAVKEVAEIPQKGGKLRFVRSELR
jgi:phenylacetate-CoA ligase